MMMADMEEAGELATGPPPLTEDDFVEPSAKQDDSDDDELFPADKKEPSTYPPKTVIPAPTTIIADDDESEDIFGDSGQDGDKLNLSLSGEDPDLRHAQASPVTTAAETQTPAVAKPVVKKAPEEECDVDDSDGFTLEIKIQEPQKIGDGMNAYVVYKVTTTTNIPIFRRKEFFVMRRFSDFLGLHEKLSLKYTQQGTIVPPAPEKSVIGMTKIKMSKEDNASSDFIERRRAALERYLNRTAVHPILRQDPDFRDFLEQTDLPKATSTSTLSGASVLKLFTKAADTVSKIATKMNESDHWFEEKQTHIDNLEQQFRRLHACLEQIVLARREQSMATGAMARSAAMLGNSEEHTALSRALAQLAEVEEKVDQLINDQANSDFYLVAELVKDYIGLIGSIKDIFRQREKTFHNWQQAEQTLTKKREIEARLSLAGKTDKVPQAKEEIREWERNVEQREQEFNVISKTIRKEITRFDKSRQRDFKQVLLDYMQSLLDTQQTLIKYWEGFLPEAKAIA